MISAAKTREYTVPKRKNRKPIATVKLAVSIDFLMC